MTDQALDDLARRVMLDAARQEYGDLIDELPEHDFSTEFERKMKRLVRRANHPIRYQVVQTAACILLAALLSGCTVLAISPEAREAFVGWVREVYETMFVYHYVGEEAERSNNIVYRPTWIPEGYQETPGPELYGQVNIIYENPEKEYILFNYVDPHEAKNFYVGKENAEHIQVMVHDLSADLYVYDVENAMNTLVWTGKNGTLFWITAALSGDDLIKIAESVEVTQ